MAELASAEHVAAVGVIVGTAGVASIAALLNAALEAEVQLLAFLAVTV